MVTNYEGKTIEFKDDLPLLPIRDLVVYPFMILPLYIGRDSSIAAVDCALNEHERLIYLASQKEVQAEHPSPSEIYDVGTVAMIMRMRRLPDGRIKILVQGLCKAKTLNIYQNQPFFKATLQKIEEPACDENDVAIAALVRNVKEQLEKVITYGKGISPDLLMVIEDVRETGRMVDLIASNLNLPFVEAQMLLETFDPIEKLHRLNDILSRELEVIGMQAKIQDVAKEEISKSQRQYFLREQIKVIKNELGEESPEEENEFVELKNKINQAGMNPEALKESLKQLARLEKMHPDSTESSTLRNYLDWMVELPWKATKEEKIDLDQAKAILDKDHFDLNKIKERILEFLAVRKLKGGKMRGPILCFAGPPGVGKTSLGQSIAKSTGREFARISLGGVKDEAEIRGHRRTYVGSMPGRFIQALKKVKSNNPVILLDEIDKLGGDYKGDPSSALLEVLDPEQNSHFVDHYLNVSFDLSNIMFIATANNLENIPGPLRDRMEIINVSGYTQEEKVAISKKYLVPKQVDENGIKKEHIDISDDALSCIVKNFTAEAGLRNLERKIGAICRKVAMKIAQGEKEKVLISPNEIENLLGPALYMKEDHMEEDEVGVCTGLAWTMAGGEVLYVEASKMKGSGLTLTGRLGETMQESAKTAIGFIRSKAKDLGISENFFNENEIHVHLPAGAIPKDGPSAGITLATTIISLATNKKISRDVAMTGEMTLTGKVLPIGGLKEKALAAMRLNIKKVIFPHKNIKDLVDIPEKYRQQIQFIPVKTIDDVLKVALNDWESPNQTSTKQATKKEGRKTPPPVAA